MDAGLSDLDAKAKRLYEACAPVAPRWEQLGENTKNVWRESVHQPYYAALLEKLDAADRA